jgi:hypothetical protein
VIGIVDPVDLAIILATAFGVLLLPGFAFVYGLGGRGRSVPEWLALAFGTSVAAVVLLAEVSRLLGRDVIVLSGAMVGLAFLAIAAGRWRPPEIADDEERYARDWWGALVLLLAVAMGLTALWQGLALTADSDSFYHLQAARSLLAEGRTWVTDPFAPAPGMPPDLKAGSWPAVPAMVSLFTGLDVLPVARVMNPFIALFLLPVVYALSRRLGAPGWAALIAAAGFAVGGTQLELRNLIFPAKVAPLVLAAGLIWLAEWSKDGGARRLGAAAACLVAAATIHPSALEAAVWVLVLAVAVAIIRRQRHTALPLSGLLAGTVGAYILIAFPALAATWSSLGAGEGEGAAAGGAALGSALWPGIGGLGVLAAGAGLLATAAVLMRKSGEETDGDTTQLVAALGAAPALVSIKRVGIGITMRLFGPALARMTFAAAFAPYVAAAAVTRDLGRLKEAGWVRRALVAASLVALLGLGVVQALAGGVVDRFGGADVRGSVAHGRAGDRSVALVPIVEALYRAGARSSTPVGAPAEVSYELAGLAGFDVIAVPPRHMSAGLRAGDGPARLSDLEAAFATQAPTPQARVEILSKYGVELAVVPGPLASQFVEAGWRRAEAVGGYVVFVAGT